MSDEKKDAPEEQPTDPVEAEKLVTTQGPA